MIEWAGGGSALPPLHRPLPSHTDPPPPNQKNTKTKGAVGQPRRVRHHEQAAEHDRVGVRGGGAEIGVCAPAAVGGAKRAVQEAFGKQQPTRKLCRGRGARVFLLLCVYYRVCSGGGRRRRTLFGRAQSRVMMWRREDCFVRDVLLIDVLRCTCPTVRRRKRAPRRAAPKL